MTMHVYGAMQDRCAAVSNSVSLVERLAVWGATLVVLAAASRPYHGNTGPMSQQQGISATTRVPRPPDARELTLLELELSAH